MMKKIALIYMGGTFGCVGEPLAPLAADIFLPKLQHLLPLDCETTCFVATEIKDSSACTAADWLNLVAQIQALQQQGWQRFIVIHGTDTLSYAAAVLSHFITNDACVVLTGSQYPLLTIDGEDTRDFSDALDNLNLAYKAIEQHEHGVYLAFHQHIVHGRSALKQHSTELDAFAGIDAKQPLLPSQSLHISTDFIEKAHTFNCISMMMQPISTQQHLQNLQQLLQNPPHCLILQGFGTANLAVDGALLSLFQQLYNEGCVIILTTQVPFGAIDQHYAINSWLADAPVLLSNCYGHADLYAKALKMYLQYDRVEQWFDHWQDK